MQIAEPQTMQEVLSEHAKEWKTALTAVDSDLRKIKHAWQLAVVILNSMYRGDP